MEYKKGTFALQKFVLNAAISTVTLQLQNVKHCLMLLSPHQVVLL